MLYYTNFNEYFLTPYQTIEDLIYVDWLLGSSSIAEPEEKSFPYDTKMSSQKGWVFLKKLAENLSKII